MKNRVLTAAAVLGLSAAIVIVFPSHNVLLSLSLRWCTLAALCAYAVAKRSLSAWIFVAMLLGIEVGHDWPHFAVKLQVLATIFLRLVKTIVAPLIFSTLVSGIAAHGDLKKVGRMGLKALIYFEVITTIALMLGLVAMNISHAGAGVKLAYSATTQGAPSVPLSGSELLLHAIPENIAKAVAEGQILQVVVFSVLFGIALALVNEKKRRPLLNMIESLAETMFKFTKIVMFFAPVGAGAAMAYTVGTTGLGILRTLATLLATFYVVLTVFVLCVLLPVALLARISIRGFVRAVAEPFTIAFATANSEAALPVAMEAMERFGVPRRVVAFVMPTGYSFNLDGAAVYLSVASLFIAQLAGRHLSLGQQVALLLTMMITSKGVAGVSRAAIMVLFATAGSFGLPTEPIFILLGIDQLLDMGRSGVNVLGNCLATVVVSRWEKDITSANPPDHVTPAALGVG
jgi:Na+/H+-dicarboxylate symporter